MQCGVMRSKSGHEKSLSEIMTMICEFSVTVLVDGGLVMPWCHPRHPTLSLVVSNPLEKKREYRETPYHRSSPCSAPLDHVVTEWCCDRKHRARAVDQWLDVFGSWADGLGNRTE